MKKYLVNVRNTNTNKTYEVESITENLEMIARSEMCWYSSDTIITITGNGKSQKFIKQRTINSITECASLVTIG